MEPKHWPYRVIGILACIASAVLVVVGVTVALAAADTTTIGVQAVDQGEVPAGTEVLLATAEVPAGTCIVSYMAQNNSSVWQGNNVVVGNVALAGVEDAPGITVIGDMLLTGPATVDVVLVVGENFGEGFGKYSIEGELSFTCEPVVTTTTTVPPPEPTVISVPPTIPPAPPAPPVVVEPDLTG